MMLSKTVQFALLILVVISHSSSAFSPTSLPSRPEVAQRRVAPLSSTPRDRQEDTDDDNSLTSRRQMLAATFATASAATLFSPKPAAATYSAYAHREEDWQTRLKNGEVQVSSARSLRSQLQEIAPMNTEGSKLFCPNGPSAAVSPLMENKCGDRAAIPSVYGRTEDTMGNSIPGFSGGRYVNPDFAGQSTNLADAVGFPAYNANMGR